MELEQNTILITGGSTGIGYALAKYFVSKNNKVIICARNQNNLLEAKKKIPSLNIYKCDLSKESERIELVTSSHP